MGGEGQFDKSRLLRRSKWMNDQFTFFCFFFFITWLPLIGRPVLNIVLWNSTCAWMMIRRPASVFYFIFFLVIKLKRICCVVLWSIYFFCLFFFYLIGVGFEAPWWERVWRAPVRWRLLSELVSNLNAENVSHDLPIRQWHPLLGWSRDSRRGRWSQFTFFCFFFLLGPPYRKTCPECCTLKQHLQLDVWVF